MHHNVGVTSEVTPLIVARPDHQVGRGNVLQARAEEVERDQGPEEGQVGGDLGQGALGLEQAERFTPKRMAAATFNTWQEALAEAPPPGAVK